MAPALLGGGGEPELPTRIGPADVQPSRDFVRGRAYPVSFCFITTSMTRQVATARLRSGSTAVGLTSTT
jgi:hypothetical protein